MPMPSNLTRRLMAAAALLLAIGAAAYWFTRPNAPRRTLVVVPARWTFLDPSGLHPSDETVAEAIAEELTRNGKVPVEAWRSVGRFRDKPQPAATIAKVLDATYILAVAVRQTGGQARISLILVEPHTGRNRWAEDLYAQDLSNSNTIQTMAASVADDVQLALGVN